MMLSAWFQPIVAEVRPMAFKTPDSSIGPLSALQRSKHQCQRSLDRFTTNVRMLEAIVVFCSANTDSSFGPCADSSL
jgi:hypothetical protein